MFRVKSLNELISTHKMRICGCLHASLPDSISVKRAGQTLKISGDDPYSLFTGLYGIDLRLDLVPIGRGLLHVSLPSL